MKLVPSPDIVNKKEEYEVEEIRKYRKKGWGTVICKSTYPEITSPQ